MAFMQDQKNRTVPRGALVFLRLFFGALILKQGMDSYNLSHTELGFEPAVLNFLSVAVGRSYEFYTPFLEDYIRPNAMMVSYALLWGQLVLGSFLLVGLLVRYSAFLIAIVALNLVFAQGLGFLSFTVENFTFWVAFTLMITNAGQSWGLDSSLSGSRRSKSIF